MKRFSRRASSLLAAALLAALSPRAARAAEAEAPPDPEAAVEKAFAAAIRKVTPSVVTIETISFEKGGEERGRFRRADGPTTGCVLSADGWVVTSSFNFKGREPVQILVRFDGGRTVTAELKGQDLSRGIAVLKADAKDLPVPEHLPRKEMRVGQWALALGRSFGGEGPSLQVGIVSALDRIFGKAIQTDAALSPANYGGPLVDLEGRVLGINVPLFTQGEDVAVMLYDTGIGFAVPFEDILALADRLKKGEVLRPAWLGVVFSKTGESGAKITQIIPGSAADKGGLKKGDVILAVDGKEIAQAFLVQFEIGRKIAGEKAVLKVRRGEKVLDVEVVFGDRPPDAELEKILRSLPVEPEGGGGPGPGPGPGPEEEEEGE